MTHTSLYDPSKPHTPPTPEDEQRARLVVCGYATDANDARELLAALGLLE